MAANTSEPIEAATPEHPSASIGAPNKVPQKKAVPTPTRKQAEQARRDRIQPVLTKKQAKAKERDLRYKARDEATDKMHSQGYNTLIRDWVDRRWNVGEFILPVMMIVLVLSLVVSSYWWMPAMVVGMYFVYILVALFIVDTFVMWRGAKKELRKFFPNEPLKGKLSYAISRTYLMRGSRRPVPRVNRGSAWVFPVVPDEPLRTRATRAKDKAQAATTSPETTKTQVLKPKSEK